MNPLKELTAWLCVVALAAGCAAGWVFGRMPLTAELATQAARHETQARAAAEQALRVLQGAQARGDALTSTLAQSLQQINKLQRDKHDAVSKATTGQPCLDGPALRLLGSAPGLRVADLPPAASGALAAGGAVASDTDITGWAIDAGAQYQTCRARLDTLIDWHQPAPRKFKLNFGKSSL